MKNTFSNLLIVAILLTFGFRSSLVAQDDLIMSINAGSTVWCMACNPEGTMIASGSTDKLVKLWDSNTGNLIRIFEGHTGLIGTVAFSPDGTKLVSGDFSGMIKVWDSNTGSLIFSFIGHDNSISSIVFSPDGTKFASGGYDYLIKVWDANTYTHIGSLSENYGGRSCVAFSPDGTKLASGSYQIHLWDMNSGKQIRIYKSISNSISFSPDGSKFAIGSSGYTSGDTIKLLDANSESIIRTFVGHKNTIWSVAFSPDGSILASGSSDKTIKLWNVNTGVLLHTFKGHNDIVYSVSFSPDSTKIVSASQDGTIKIWRVPEAISVEDEKNKTEEISIIPNPSSEYIEINFGADSRRHTADGKFQCDVRIYNKLGECVLSVEQTPSSVQRIDVSLLPTGIYFVRVGTVTMSFVVMR